MFYEKRMTSLGRLSHKQHDETRPAKATMIQTYSESKFVDFISSFPFSLSVQLSFLYKLISATNVASLGSIRDMTI